MSLNRLKATLALLQDASASSSVSVYKDIFTLIEHLINPKNIEILVTVLLTSEIWSSENKYDICHDYLSSSRYLSSDKASLHHGCLLKAIRRTKCPLWRKSVMLAALTYAEMRDSAAQELSWLSNKGKYGRSFVTATNEAYKHDKRSADTDACLLVALSYVWSSLTPYQQSNLNQGVRFACMNGLYTSTMLSVQTSATSTMSRGFKELGLLSRTTALVIDNLPAIYHKEALLLLLQTSGRLDKLKTENERKAFFFSIVTIQQVLLASVLRSAITSTTLDDIAFLSLSTLRNLQGVNPDNSIYESWRFCFNLSLDMLARDPAILTAYLDRLLDSSPLALNPLAIKDTTKLFSRAQDDRDMTWLLLIVESTTSEIHSPATLRRIFDHCFKQLIEFDSSMSSSVLELYHSILLSLFTNKWDMFSKHVAKYINYVLSHDEPISDRQFEVLFTSLYRRSLRLKVNDQTEDPAGILSALIARYQSTLAGEKRRKLLRTHIELLPAIPPSYLLRNLRIINYAIQSQEESFELDAKFTEICTTEMDTERAVICVKFLLSRGQSEQIARARL